MLQNKGLNVAALMIDAIDHVLMRKKNTSIIINEKKKNCSFRYYYGRHWTLLIRPHARRTSKASSFAAVRF